MADSLQPGVGSPVAGRRGVALRALLMTGTAAWCLFLYRVAYPRLFPLSQAWRDARFPRLPDGLRPHAEWAAIPLAALLILGCYSLGRRVMRRWLDPGLPSAQARLLAAPFGLALVALAMFVLACLGWLRRPVMIGVWGAALAAGLGEIRSDLAALRGRLAVMRLRPGLFASFSTVALFVQADLAAAVAISPEVSYDPLHFHLVAVEWYLGSGGFARIPGYVPAHLPELGHLLYVPLFDLVGDAGPRALTWCAALLLVALVAAIAAETGGRRAGWIAALILGSTPALVSSSTVPQLDVLLALFAVSAFWVALRSGVARGAWLAGLLVGAAAATKLVGAVLAPGVVLIALLGPWNEGRRAVSRQMLSTAWRVICGAAVVALPFYVKNWVALGNPVFPLLPSVFGYSLMTPEEHQAAVKAFTAAYGMGREMRQLVRLPWNMTVHGERFAGVIGALFLSLVPFVLATARRRIVRGMLLVLALNLGALWVSQHVQRYLFTGLALLAVVIALAIEDLAARGNFDRAWRYGLLGLVAATSIVHLPFFFNSWLRDWFVYELREIPVENAAGLESREAFITRHLSCYPLALQAAGSLPPDAKVALFPGWGEEPPPAWLPGKLVEFFAAEWADQAAIAEAAHGPEAMAAALRSRGFTHLLVRFLVPGGHPFSEESAFGRTWLQPAGSAGGCRLYAIQPHVGPRVAAELISHLDLDKLSPDVGRVFNIVRAGTDSRLTLTVLGNRQISLPITIPAGRPWFESALAMAYPLGDGAIAVLTFVEGGRRHELARVPLEPVPGRDKPDRGWVPVRVDLGEFAGRTGELVFATDPGPARDDTADWVGWASPRIYESP